MAAAAAAVGVSVCPGLTVDSASLVSLDRQQLQPGRSWMVVVADPSALSSGVSSNAIQPGLTVTDRRRAVRTERGNTSALAGARYWLVGCLTAEAAPAPANLQASPGFHWVEVGQLSREDPAIVDSLHCHTLLREAQPAAAPAWCQEVNLDVAVHDSLTNRELGGGEGVEVTVLRLEEGEEELLMRGAAPATPALSVPLSRPGHYVVEATGPGWVATRETVEVDCDVSRCGECRPRLLLPLSPALPPRTARVTLGWAATPRDLDLYALQRSSSAQSCLTYHARPAGCQGAKLDLDHYGGGDTGVETLTFTGQQDLQQVKHNEGN